MMLGGRPITDYAHDFWLIQDGAGRRVGYVTSPWYSPELKTNIALGYVPVELSDVGTRLHVEVPESLSEISGQPVAAEVVEVPFRPSVNPSTRERLKAQAGTAA
jgi:aminomethyltransferase